LRKERGFRSVVLIFCVAVVATAFIALAPSSSATYASTQTGTQTQNETSTTITSSITSTASTVPSFHSFIDSLPSQIKDSPLLGLGIIVVVILLSVPFIGKSKKKQTATAGVGAQKPMVRANATPQRVSSATTSAPPPQKSLPAGPDPWDVLGLQRNSSRDTIKQKYHDLLVELHPDRLPQGATPAQRKVIDDKVKEITSAYNRLKQQGHA
jgi:DnaJ domain